MTDERSAWGSPPRGGIAHSQYGQHIEQDLWSGDPQGPGASDLTFEYPEQALLHRSLRLVPVHQDAGTQSQSYPGVHSMMGMPMDVTNFWWHESMAAVKKEESNEELQLHQLQQQQQLQQLHQQHSVGSYTDAREEYERDQRPPSSRDSLSTSMPSRPHAAVEKRYRRTVNTKLQQLHAAIPASGTFSLDPAERARSSLDGSEPEQAAKPVVLDKAIQYTTHLIETYRKYDDDIEVLRQQVREWLGDDRASASLMTENTKRVG